jgi:DeoR/GlpR family transcriptional regulator of sugar metabolism
MPKKIFVEERRNKILDYVQRLNRVNVTELAEKLEVTKATIRLDLTFLEGEGLIHRTHGGGIKRNDNPAFWKTIRIEERLITYKEEKKRIAEFAAQFIHDGESVVIDGGSTNIYVAEYLVGKKELMVVTNSPAVGTIFLRETKNKVLLLGGEFLRESFTVADSTTEAILRNMRFTAAIIGATGITPEEGLFCNNSQEGQVKRMMIHNSSKTIVVSDSSKINAHTFYCFSEFEHIDILITDKNISKEALHTIRQKGVEVYTV